MPDGPTGSANRRAWRLMAAAGVILGSLGLLFNALGFTERQDAGYRAQRAICAVIEYSEETLASATPKQRAADLDGTIRFERLIREMRATGVKCPPPKPKPLLK